MKLLELKSLAKLLVLVICCLMGSGCIFFAEVEEVHSAAIKGQYGYNKVLTINSDPQGAHVLINVYGTYKSIGTTPLTYPINFQNNTNIRESVDLALPGYHPHKIKIIHYYSYVDEKRIMNFPNLFFSFFVDCLFSPFFCFLNVAGDVLIGFPMLLNIPKEAYTCDYLGARIVYDGTPVKLIPANVPLPQAQVQYIPQYDSGSNIDAEVINAFVTGIGNAAATAMSRPSHTPSPAPRITQPKPAPVPRTPTTMPNPNFKRRCSKHGEWDVRFSVGCPACRGTIKWGFE